MEGRKGMRMRLMERKERNGKQRQDNFTWVLAKRLRSQEKMSIQGDQFILKEDTDLEKKSYQVLEYKQFF